MKILSLFLLASVSASAQTWTDAAVEGQTVTLPDTIVRYGAGTSWVEKKIPGSTVPCTNAVFGDPIIGTVKKCQVQAPAATVPPPDHSMHGPMIDPALIPPRTTATDKGPNPWDGLMLGSAPQVKAADIDPATGLPWPSQTPNPSEGGAFREPCYFGFMSYDDPIVHPGAPGTSHLHVFFGNMAIDAYTTIDNIHKTTTSSCAGAALNMSGYWVPAVVDAATHAPLKPVSILTYYKNGLIDPKLIKPIPVGLRMVSGNAQSVDPAGQHGINYICNGVNGENPGWKKSIGDAAKDLSCNQEGADFVQAVGFPQCWDGKNLDSPDHRSHLTNWVSTWDGHAATYACPSTHPVALPEISYNVHYRVPKGGVSSWRLASDAYDPMLPGGLSGHGDYFMGWDLPTMNTFVARCTGGYQDCHAYLLGDGRTLY